LAAAGPAGAYDLRALGGADFLLTTGPSVSGVEDAELGLTLHGDLRDVAHRFDFKLDFAGREGFVGNSTWNNLYELYGAARRLAGGRLDVTVGRFRTPTGFWLTADGAMVTVRYTPWLSQSVFGGLRAFNTGRRATWMTTGPMRALPLAGTALAVNHRLVTGSLSFAYSKDDLVFYSGEVPTSKSVIEEHKIEDEFFLDGQVSVFPHPKIYLSAGASLGTRYDQKFDVNNPYGPSTIGVATLGAFGVYGFAEWRPWKPLRLAYTFVFERVRLYQSELLVVPGAQAPQAADGSFEDHQLRATYLVWRALRLEAVYRLRYRANTDLEHHVTMGARGDDLWRGLGAFASIGVDVNSGIDLPGADPAQRKVHNRIIYSGGLSYVRAQLDLRAGVLFTDGIGSGLVFSTHTATPGAKSELFPYVLESNRIAFVRAFALFWKMYAGVDLEENLDQGQLRMLAQVGAWL
jgi:hypothetical protein